MAIKTNTEIFLIIFGILASILSIGCLYGGTNIEGASWKLESYLSSEENIISPMPETKLTIVFDKEKASGTSGCNSFFSSYEVKGNSIKFGPIGSTLMYCTNPEVMDQEQTYFMRLGSIKSYKIEGNKLSLIDGNNRVVLIYSKN